MHRLQERLAEKKLVLASGSPRRQELLKGLDIPYTIELREVNEVYPDDLKAHDITDFLACLKAYVFDDLDENTIVITADTIVWLAGQALMKPNDRAAAIAMLTQMSGKCHEVYTSVCIKSHNKNRVFYEKTEVCFSQLTQQDIEYYVDNYPVYDKAGSYGAQDWIGYVAIDKLTGSYFNVMGLPVHRLYKELMAF